MKRRRRKHRRNMTLHCSTVGGKRRGRKGHRKARTHARKGRKVRAKIRQTAAKVKAVWKKHRAQLMKLAPKKRFKKVWQIIRSGR